MWKTYRAYTALKPHDLDRKQRSVSVFVGLWQSLHSPEYNIVPASTVAPLSRPVAKWQNADWPTVWILFLYSFLGQPGGCTRSCRAQEATQSTSEKKHSSRENSNFGKPFGPAFDRREEGKHSNKHHSHWHKWTCRFGAAASRPVSVSCQWPQ